MQDLNAPKTCRKCLITKRVKDFYVNRGRRKSPCKICYQDYQREYCKNHPRRLRRSYAQKKIDSIRAGARKRNIDFSLKVGELRKLLEQRVCYYCGDTPQLNSVDRKDNSKGYHFDNLVLSCINCNRIKNARFSVEEMRLWLQLKKSLEKKNQRKVHLFLRYSTPIIAKEEKQTS